MIRTSKPACNSIPCTGELCQQLKVTDRVLVDRHVGECYKCSRHSLGIPVKTTESLRSKSISKEVIDRINRYNPRSHYDHLATDFDDIISVVASTEDRQDAVKVVESRRGHSNTHPGALEALVGRTYGYLTILSFLPKVGNNRRCVCRCICDTIKEFQINNLKSGQTTSCGCMKYKNKRKSQA